MDFPRGRRMEGEWEGEGEDVKGRERAREGTRGEGRGWALDRVPDDIRTDGPYFPRSRSGRWIYDLVLLRRSSLYLFSSLEDKDPLNPQTLQGLFLPHM